MSTKFEPAKLTSYSPANTELDTYDCNVAWEGSKTLLLEGNGWTYRLKFTYAQVPDDNPTHTMPRVQRKRGGGYEFL